MMSFKNFLNEVITYKEDYTIENEELKTLFNKSINSKKLLMLCTFKIKKDEFFCYLIKNGKYLEPHFGTFIKEGMIDYIRNNYKEKEIREYLLKNHFFMSKNDDLDFDINFSTVLSYVFSILTYYVKNNGFPALIRVVASDKRNKNNHSKLSIYKNLLNQLISKEKIPYIILDTNKLDNKSSDDKSLEEMSEIILLRKS